MQGRERLLRIRRGRAPNCSAVGSVVGVAIASAAVGAALINAWADRFLRWASPGPEGAGGPGQADGAGEAGGVGDAGGEGARGSARHPDGAAPRLRREEFGGIVAWPSPPSLLYVDRRGADDAARAGAIEVGRAAPESVPGALRAPTEAHLPVTGACPARCEACYLDIADAPAEPTFEALRGRLRELADLGVFEVAFGGGEALLRDDLPELVEEARARGLVPNLTTSGFGLTPALARRLAPHVGQVNVSLDGLGPVYSAVRGWQGADLALDAIDTLVAHGVRTGVNTVICGPNLDHLDRLADELVRRGVGEWLWLRCKPAGRGTAAWAGLRPTPTQLETLWPRALAIEARTGLSLRFDCALTPFVAAHEPPREQAERLGLVGCVGGESLWTGTLDGGWRPCSFAPPFEQVAGAGAAVGSSLAERWAGDSELVAWRARETDPPEPCGSCAWQAICRGGCRAVAWHLTGDAMAPDPACPRVRAASGAAA